MTRSGRARTSPRSTSTEMLERRDLRLLDHTWRTWVLLTPAERLRRSQSLRARLRAPRKVHDAKLFPKPGP